MESRPEPSGGTTQAQETDETNALNNFEWLDDSLLNNDCYVSHDYSRAAKTVDFGCDGFTASMADWHFLLQMTAPDAKCGVIYARGNFPDDADAILARTQNEEGQGGWGFRISKDSNIKLGGFLFQGLINYRWPCFSYLITTRSEENIGKLYMCTYIKDDVLSEVIVIRRYAEKNKDDEKSKKSEKSKDNEKSKDDEKSRDKLTFQFGGPVRFGCFCSNDTYKELSQNRVRSPDSESVHPRYNLKHSHDNRVRSTICEDGKYQDVRLDMQVFINGNAEPFDDQANNSHLSYIDMSTQRTIDLSSDSQTVIIGSLSLITDKGVDNFHSTHDSSADIEKYLGVTSHSEASTGKLWVDSEKLSIVMQDHSETHTIARCVERIMGVSLVPSIHLKPPVHGRPGIDLSGTDLAQRASKVETNGRSSSLPRPALSELSTGQDKSRPSSASGVKDRASEKPIVDIEAGDDVPRDNEGSAVIKNIMTKQYVTWESTFWQARLLVKAHNYLKTQRPLNISSETSVLRPSRPSDLQLSRDEIYQSYLTKIWDCVQQILLWIMCIEKDVQHELFPTGRATSSRDDCEGGFFDDEIDTNTFRTITVWYVMKFCKTELDTAFFNALVKYLERLEERLVSTTDDTKTAIPLGLEPQQKLQYALLKWAHFGSLHEICKKLAGEGYSGYSEEGNLSMQVTKNRNEWRIESDKALKALRKRPPDQKPLVDPAQVYLSSDEEVDRFVALCSELEFETWDSLDTAEQIVKRTRTRVGKRKASTKLNPGMKLKESSRSEDFSAPWELSCLNHHIYLAVSVLSAEDADLLRSAKDNCLRFMLSDFDVVPSWDRSTPDTVGNWWDVETASIVCATLIDLKGLEKTRAENRESSTDFELQRKQTMDRSREPMAEDERPLALKDVQQLLSRDVPDVKEIIPFDWKALQPPGYASHYHPEFVLHSLDDTPEDFTQDRRKRIELRSDLEDYFRKRPPVDAGDWSIEAIHDILHAEDVLYTNLIDYSLNQRQRYAGSERFLSYEGISRGIVLRNTVAECIRKIADTKITDTSSVARARQIWSYYLNGNADESPEWLTLSQEDRDVLKTSQDLQEQYKEILLDHLSDSFVDQGMKYRIVFAQRLSPTWLRAFIYIWHPDALDAFNNYISTDSLRSTFEDIPGGDYSLWTTSITISHWAFKPKGFPKSLADRFDEGRGSGQMPPEEHQQSSQSSRRARRLRNKEQVLEPIPEAIRDLEERSSTIVITGDSLGIYWNCSILSPLVEDDVIAGFDYHDMWSYHRQAMEILQMFIHQPTVGRRLVFVALVGHLCVDLAKEYNAIVVHLERALEDSRHIIFDGFKLDKSSRALTRLPRLFWGLETFRAFDNTLSLSVAEIQTVKRRLDHDIREPKKQWSPDLQEEYENVIEEFDKRYEALSRVLDNIKQKVEQIGRLRDGISSITQVQQSFESLEQNSNIRILTFITIGYLPLGFIAALFSIGNYPILPSSSGKGLFIGLIFVFMVATIIFAYLMKPVSAFLDHMLEDWHEWWREFIKHKSEKTAINNSNAKSAPNQKKTRNSVEEDEKADSKAKKSTGFKIGYKIRLRRHISETGGPEGDIEAGVSDTTGAQLGIGVPSKNEALNSSGERGSTSIEESGKEK